MLTMNRVRVWSRSRIRPKSGPGQTSLLDEVGKGGPCPCDGVLCRPLGLNMEGEPPLDGPWGPKRGLGTPLRSPPGVGGRTRVPP